MRLACNGGCPKDRFATSPYGEPGQHYLCPGYQAFFHHIAKPMDTMAMLLRTGQAPANLMTTYARQDAQRGRNTPAPAPVAANGNTAAAPGRPSKGATWPGAAETSRPVKGANRC